LINKQTEKQQEPKHYSAKLQRRQEQRSMQMFKGSFKPDALRRVALRCRTTTQRIASGVKEPLKAAWYGAACDVVRCWTSTHFDVSGCGMPYGDRSPSRADLPRHLARSKIE